MTRRLTQSDKRRIFELIYERDGGLHCLYCKKLQTTRTVVFEHLDNDDTDNRIDNLAFSCQSCNIKKAKKDDRILTLADCKITMNERGLYVGEKFSKSFSNKIDIYGQPSKEIEISKKNYTVVEQYLRDIIEKSGTVLYSDILDSCVYLCKTATGYGSHQSMRNYIATLTASVAPYEIVRNAKNKKIIQKRLSNS